MTDKQLAILLWFYDDLLRSVEFNLNNRFEELEPSLNSDQLAILKNDDGGYKSLQELRAVMSKINAHARALSREVGVELIDEDDEG